MNGTPQRQHPASWPPPARLRPVALAAVLALHGLVAWPLLQPRGQREGLPGPLQAVTVQLLPPPPAAKEAAPLPMPPAPAVPPPVVLRLTDRVAALPALPPQGALLSLELAPWAAMTADEVELSASSWPALDFAALDALGDAGGLFVPAPDLRFLLRPQPARAPEPGEFDILLRLRFDAQGAVESVEVLRPALRDELNAAALKAWRQSRIEPVLRDGRPAPVMTEILQVLPIE